MVSVDVKHHVYLLTGQPMLALLSEKLFFMVSRVLAGVSEKLYRLMVSRVLAFFFFFFFFFFFYSQPCVGWPIQKQQHTHYFTVSRELTGLSKKLFYSQPCVGWPIQKNYFTVSRELTGLSEKLSFMVSMVCRLLFGLSEELFFFF